MARTEMIQASPSVALARPSTPPSSPSLPSSERVVTLSNAQEFIEMVKAVVAMQIASSPASKCTCSPTNQTSSQVVTTEHVQQFLDILQSLSTTQGPPPPPAKPSGESGESKAGKSEDLNPAASGDNQPEDAAAAASRLEFKTVDELWDGKAHSYTIMESLKPVGQVTGLDLYVFVVRRRVDKKTKVTTTYIDVKSELLRDILRDVLKDVRGISLNESKLSIEQNLLYTTLPELELCQSWNEIAPLDQEATSHLGLLVDYLRSAYADTTQSMLSLQPTGHITYDLLWAFFKPNALVYTTCFGTHKPRCVRYNFGEEKKTVTGTKYWSLDCSYLDFNGEDLGLFPIELKIAKFRGAKHINALEAFPLQYHADATRVRADLLGCGQKFMSLRGTHHRYCNGSAFYVRDGQQVEVRIDSRIMVDAAYFRKMNPNYFRPTVLDLNHGFDLSAYWDPLNYDSSDEASSEASSDDGSIATSFDLASETSPAEPEGSVVRQAETTDELLFICCPTVPGFSLKDKMWVEFAVADITQIEWSSAPFDSLTLPDEQRETIMAVTETETSRDPDHEFDDFVDGKGRGVIVLLHGKPGVGKTLTVEAIAEHRQKPMYSVSAGDLLTDTNRLESQLFKIFQLARHWDAILLLDEADVFLEERAPKDIVRNGVVSLFLRTMEYCQSIMLLTTNRVTEFDPAALSRIHLKVKYDDLKSDAKSAVWRGFLDRACTSYGDPSISADELKRLSKTHLNGREIRNTVAIARKIAIRQKSIVLFSHLKQAVAASKEFLSSYNGPDHVSSVFL